MGIIVKRGIAISLLTYLGVVLGYINVLWLYPKAFSIEELGLFRLLQDSALLLVPFTQIGSGQSYIKFFPEATTQTDKAGYLIKSFILSAIGLLLAGIVCLFVYFNADLFSQKGNQQLITFLPIVFVLIIILNFQNILEYAARAHLHFRMVSFSKEVLTRLLFTVLVSLYLLNFISYGVVLYGLLLVYGIVFTAILVYISPKIKLSVNNILQATKQGLKHKQFYIYGLISLLGSAGSSLVMRADSVMIGYMVGNAMVGIYTTVFYMAAVIEIPKRIIAYVAVPLLSQAFEKKDKETIAGIYRKSSVNLLLLAGLMLAGILCNLDSLFSFMPKGEIFAQGSVVVSIIGLSKLLDLAFGLNSELLYMSPYYKFNLYFTLILGIANVLLNYLLIPILSIEGAATASLISVVCFNLLKYIFLYRKLQLQPFNINTFKSLAILLIVALVGFYLPEIQNPFLDIAYRSISMLAVFLFGILVLKPSEELENIKNKALQFLKL